MFGLRRAYITCLFATRIFAGNIQEVVLPRFMLWLKDARKGDAPATSRALRESKLPQYGEYVDAEDCFERKQ